MKKMVQIKYKEVKTKRVNDYETTFKIEPLERGFGSTIGTALRRTLLSSITSVVPFAIKIKDVDQEFDTISDIVEDVQMIMLNVKNIHLVYDENIFEDNKIYRGVIETKNEKITSSDLKFPENPEIEIVNKDLEIATNNGQKPFVMEVYFHVGRGYISFEDNKKLIEEKVALLNSTIKRGKFLAIDSDFSPVEKVKVKVQEINSSSLNIEEELEIEIKTKGTIDTKNILSQAAQILIAHLQVIGDVKNLDAVDVFEQKKQEKVEPSIHSVDITSLDLSVRSINALKRQGYTKLADILTLTEDDLVAVKNLGKKSVEEIIQKLKEYNVTLNRGEK
ncbi:DNA-DIRECTED RNA POLYMERASE ALPHA CHAIN (TRANSCRIPTASE ALPHA CHAIN) (RNA POLYMERASE ALPHA SUBUNIT)rpo [Mycoplasmopsis pulmonis]|uniref:DNA-directed RNA polymerase subunit alpha n=1 Tax=Mycoplasmopsis pulmonis (strain UAB CTIP) TaxID=272635 RepID=RPOA_MYCPU|nr:DNA-directed RNA polymerase subunit alpha [Mycoplasmopsis pulmonis]Q98Q08.1 RecName: Full=DNA-directed RNA polymerase subunit alpha; Short=RNAP subunit alpha; AltName: Full=RNA polymerase subunit alpha; AltName: Full=Transcriptase subunit alpha [Mycoplasmopsis pulmonis UAB CTIP]MDZ7293635.1 DNA-directed RNA polymerase subunit alpha [Mycoplasmopsis pulmonis]CAC13734.1 DNA-DIRECTED RNA POLYMERASE ALPHA CHAIN (TRANSCRIPTASE ALPHA CHAIN) (RNA POLYMERASE ALPHA SUBUNIT)rpo [Mycoplasmopsis pulmonis]